ncbi:hypothetical protein B0A79_20820 [Flavobacterium piscis]|uniref:Uncharacterized protein n=1 Tax=Flavobacterium piscis TaxID=1114874 RepID=A0ABX2XIW1_9FLAO|nr:hypothetical protein [Flavobacterium piscis]OCB73795.1 hypothetical protein FLP_14065 [Flavobacterium piscis]OXE98616.1 hypothetical protein B0A79_20820 [Flavobacterium piscis]
MKKLITPINIAIFFWGLMLIAISQLYPDYTRYYLYLSIAVIVPVSIVNLVKEKKEDKLNNTENFKFSIYRMLFMVVILCVFFFITKQNHI